MRSVILYDARNGIWSCERGKVSTKTLALSCEIGTPTVGLS